MASLARFPKLYKSWVCARHDSPSSPPACSGKRTGGSLPALCGVGVGPESRSTLIYSACSSWLCPFQRDGDQLLDEASMLGERKRASLQADQTQGYPFGGLTLPASVPFRLGRNQTRQAAAMLGPTPMCSTKRRQAKEYGRSTVISLESAS